MFCLPKTAWPPTFGAPGSPPNTSDADQLTLDGTDDCRQGCRPFEPSVAVPAVFAHPPGRFNV